MGLPMRGNWIRALLVAMAAALLAWPATAAAQAPPLAPDFLVAAAVGPGTIPGHTFETHGDCRLPDQSTPPLRRVYRIHDRSFPRESSRQQ